MPCEMLSLILPSIFLKAVFELYCRSESLFFLLALTLDTLAMCTVISLNVLETALAVPYGIELRSGYAAVRYATRFLCHALSPFYASADGLTRFNGYQPIKRHEGIYKGEKCPGLFSQDSAYP